MSQGPTKYASHDGGETWDIANEIILRDDGPNHDLGYPASIELAPGELLTVYYQIARYIGPAAEKPSLIATRWSLMQGARQTLEAAQASGVYVSASEEDTIYLPLDDKPKHPEWAGVQWIWTPADLHKWPAVAHLWPAHVPRRRADRVQR
jgi:hypothetical protein